MLDVDKLFAHIRALGRLPKEMSKPMGDEQIAEAQLAGRLRKAKRAKWWSSEHKAELQRITNALQPVFPLSVWDHLLFRVL